MIKVNGTIIGEDIVCGEKCETYMIPKECVKEGDSIVLHIYLSDAVSPTSQGESEDSRSLGIGLKSLVIDME